MLCCDAMGHIQICTNTNDVIKLTIEAVCEIEKELLCSPYDMTSLVFLLYDVPDTALQRLLVYQRVAKDAYSTNLNLLHEWIQVAKSSTNWRNEFLEALLICQLFGIVRKLGFNVQTLKTQYQPDSISFNMYINPMKKALYRLCENMTSENLNTLKKTLNTYQIDTSEYDSCELVFLKLMSEKIITLSEFQLHKKTNDDFNFDKLVKLLQKLPGMESIASELGMIQNRSNSEPIQPVAASFPSLDLPSDFSKTMPQQSEKKNYQDDFSAIYDMLNDLNLDDHIKSDSKKKLAKDSYPIKNPKNIGLCLIINQEDFHLCDQSIEDPNLRGTLSYRKGSSLDKIELEKTMSSFNFEVISRDNLNHNEMKKFIKESINIKVKDTTSIFMLCIMSHGVRDHVFAADSVKVKVEDIQNLLDDAENLRGIPKVLIIQACQVDDVPQTTLVADSPTTGKFELNMRKLDFLVYLATSPEYEAYRAEGAGSIFIQLLCAAIKKKGKKEHLEDIFTKVNNGVVICCTRNRCIQVPYSKSSLRKKLYLHIPE